MLPNPCGRENGVSKDCVTVSPCQDGIEILINAKGNNLALSRGIQELLKQGLDVVTCVSANVNQNSLHKIQSEVCTHYFHMLWYHIVCTLFTICPLYHKNILWRCSSLCVYIYTRLKDILSLICCLIINHPNTYLQVGDVKCINLHALQRKLIDVINIDNLV